MIPYPQVSPTIVSIGPMQVHWYGVMYLLSFLAAWLVGVKQLDKVGWTRTQFEDLLFYCALGVILGGRSGYMLFYSPVAWHQPLEWFRIWHGGMSFHGGLLGVMLGMAYFARKYQLAFLLVCDFLAPLVPLGLFFGRLGNFINGELWGRVTSVPWAMLFPDAGPYPRHPSQLYEAFFEGLVLFSVLWCFSSKKRVKGYVSALFLLGYGLARFVIEFVREPDVQLGYIVGNWMTMGQLLTIPMLLGALVLFWIGARSREI